MKKFDIKTIILVTILLIAVLLGITSCNMAIVDTTFSFEQAIISLPNGDIIEGKVTNWKDWEDDDMVQVKIDGKTYLTHSSNVVLISK